MAYPGLKENYPQSTSSSEGCLRTYVYRAPTASLPQISYGIIYLGHPVQTSTKEQVGLSSLYELTIVTLQRTPALDGDGIIIDDPEGDEGSIYIAPPVTVGPPAEVVDGQYPFFEIEWAQTEKALKFHPAFASSTVAEWAAIDAWEKETELQQKAIFKFYYRDKENSTTGGLQTLGATGLPDSSQQDYAKLRFFGVESFLDFAPVARKSSRFRGWNAPETSDAGQKVGSDPFTGVPSGYLWLKSADRSSKQGFGNEWIRQEEWLGARIILLDKDEIFI